MKRAAILRDALACGPIVLHSVHANQKRGEKAQEDETATKATG
jgi:hypothetical protein